MAGVPHHAAKGYVAKLVAAGHKVAICDQVEVPGPGKKLVRREIVRLVTPGTLVDEEALQSREPIWLAALALEEDRAALALLDASTGELRALPPGRCAATRGALAGAVRAGGAGAQGVGRGARRAARLSRRLRRRTAAQTASRSRHPRWLRLARSLADPGCGRGARLSSRDAALGGAACGARAGGAAVALSLHRSLGGAEPGALPRTGWAAQPHAPLGGRPHADGRGRPDAGAMAVGAAARSRSHRRAAGCSGGAFPGRGRPRGAGRASARRARHGAPPRPASDGPGRSARSGRPARLTPTDAASRGCSRTAQRAVAQIARAAVAAAGRSGCAPRPGAAR